MPSLAFALAIGLGLGLAVGHSEVASPADFCHDTVSWSGMSSTYPVRLIADELTFAELPLLHCPCLKGDEMPETVTSKDLLANLQC